MEADHLLTSVILFDLALFDIKTSHFEFYNWCECFIEVIDKQERETSTEHLAFCDHNIVHTMFISASLISSH